MTREALHTSLMRYCSTVVESGDYEHDLRKTETCGVNVVARKVAGVSRSARLSVLRATTGFLSAHHLCIQHCANLFGLGLSAQNSSSQRRLEDRARQLFGVDG